MPIANCIITPDCVEGPANLLELWSVESHLSSEHMTINIIASSKQLGNRYKVMVNLMLPSMWSSANVSKLQTGLARALVQHFSVEPADVHVITTVVNSGLVVESGVEVTW